MGCGCSNTSATDKSLDDVRDAVLTGAGVAAYIVSGAGSPVVNGVYVRDGKYQDMPCFRNGQVWLVYWGDSWYIADKDKLDEDSTEGDYYRIDTEELLPPVFGWEAVSEGVEPVPTIVPVDEGPAALLVEGAGLAQVNGQYRRDGTYDGAAKYAHVAGQLVIVRSRGNWFRWMIADKDTLEEPEGDLYKSIVASEYPPLAQSHWEVQEDGRAPPPSVRALDGLDRPVVPGWIPLEQGPAQVAVATYVAEASTPVVTGFAIAATA